MANASRLTDNLNRIQYQIRAAAERSGRNADNVTLVIVTKYVRSEVAALCVEAGFSVLGESRPQELWRKQAELKDLAVQWHMIGHLQRNKVRRTLPLMNLFHACDSRRLLAELEQQADSLAISPQVLLEVNVSEDASKHGFAVREMEEVIGELGSLARVQVVGLMGMASLAGDLQSAASEFAQLRALRDRLTPNCPDNVSLHHLSMGMSRDFEAAIAEGATIVRVGSAAFEGV